MLTQRKSHDNPSPQHRETQPLTIYCQGEGEKSGGV